MFVKCCVCIVCHRDEQMNDASSIVNTLNISFLIWTCDNPSVSSMVVIRSKRDDTE